MEKISFSNQNVAVDGLYYPATEGSPLVIIINGHNGFYSYGMFPHIQERLEKDDIASYSFNFSHGGVRGDEDRFEDLDKYRQNCMRLEVEDVMCVLQNLHSPLLRRHSATFLLAHSLGGVPAIFAARQAESESIDIGGMILVSTVKSLNFWPGEMVEEWKQNKVYYKKNNRTQQLLPQGEEFLSEVLESETRWNVESEIKNLSLPMLIIHGESDEAIPAEHSVSKYEWIRDGNKNNMLKIIPGATHTFNTRHPFDGASLELGKMEDEVIRFIKKIAG